MNRITTYEERHKSPNFEERRAKMAQKCWLTWADARSANHDWRVYCWQHGGV